MWGPAYGAPENFAFLERGEFDSSDYEPAAQLTRFLIQRYGVETYRRVYSEARPDDSSETIEAAFLSVFGDEIYDPAHPHVAIDGPELVAQLGRNLVDVPQGSSLHEIAIAVSARPGLLTQLGITTKTLRGVERLGQLAEGGRPSLSPLSYLDGVEFCRDSLPNGEYRQAHPSKLGPGALRFDAPPGTLATSLPTAVVLATSGALPRARHPAAGHQHLGVPQRPPLPRARQLR